MWLDLGEYHGPSHFHALVRFMIARRERRNQELSYRTYVTDSLMNAPQGRYISTRWADLITPHEDIDADAIIEHVIARVSEE